MDTGEREAVIDCRNLWKIFGVKADQAMKAVQEQGLGKTEVRDQFDCVVGVQDAS
ncbi:MAG: glycine/betaine ABC transporter, partial [Pseudomonadota bacterium]|nr:glycine/betaine ABC transporter [Pseudomonadota bacterium]